MKIIEALKKTKYLEKKTDDLKNKIANFCCKLDYETATYPDQQQQVSEWIQSYKDILKEIGRLHYCIQKTNNNTQVEIEIDRKTVKKSLAEWILRRRKLCGMELNLYSALTDRNLKEGKATNTAGTLIDVKIVRYFDPKERDHMRSLLSEEPMLIDSKLEIVNAVTDLVE